METHLVGTTRPARAPAVAARSFLRFVYPFTAPPAAGRLVRASLEALLQGEAPLWQPYPITEEPRLRDLTRQFRRDSLRAWRIGDAALRGVLAFGDSAPWEIRIRSDFAIAWRMTSIELWWFEDHVGFLTFEAAPIGSDPATWLDFLHHFRFDGGWRLGKIRPLGTGNGADGAAPMPAWAHGQGDPASRGWTDLLSLIRALLAPAGLGRDAASRWRTLTDAQEMFPFACLFVDGMPADEQPLFRHRLRHAFHTGQGHNAAPDDLETRDHPCYLTYARDQYFTFSMNGGGFIAFDRPDDVFNQRALPEHLEIRYWFVLMLLLHQRFALISFSRATTEYWEQRAEEATRDGEEQTAATFDQMEQLYRRLLTFTAHGYFAQVVQLDHYHRFYRRWVEVFQLPILYAEVRDEIAEMRAYLDLIMTRQAREREQAAAREVQRRADAEQRLARAAEDQAKRLEQRLNFFALLLGVPALFITGAAATGQLSGRAVVGWSMIGLLIGGILLVFLSALERWLDWARAALRLPVRDHARGMAGKFLPPRQETDGER